MIKFLRRAVKSLPAQILLGLLVVSFAVWGIGDIFSAGGPGAVATVGETEVPAERYADALARTQRVLSQQQREAVSMRELRETGIADATLASLVREAAFAEELDRLGIAVPAEAVRRAIVDNPAFQDGQGAFNQFLYQSRINNAGYSPQAYEAATRELLGQQLLTDAFAPVAAPPPGMAEAIAAHAGEERTLAYVRLTPDMVPEPAAPGPEALAAWFEENVERFREPERRTGLYLHTNLEELAVELAPTEEEVRAEYEAHPQAYSVEATREVEQIVFDDEAAAQAALERIRAGEASFAEIAAEQNVSIADLSLGTVTREQLPDASAEAVFGVTEPGVVGPVEGIFGPMLLNVTAVQEGGTAPLEQVADRIRGVLADRLAREAAVDRANAIDDLRASGTPLPEIAEQIGLDLVRFEGLDPQGNVAAGEAPPLASVPAFMAEVNAAIGGEERDVIQMPDGSYVLVMVEEIADSHLPELDAIRDRVVEAWKAEQRMQALEERATELAARIAAQGGIEAVATAEGLGAPETLSFTRQRVPAPLSPALAEAAFAAEPGDPLTGRAR
ncbi:MAG TPA: SurA N-terminal domain-containing protein, partial [Paracoccaceae bacterium]|nr:SurA N-terminal domain-containing protein [Paracoccaceae bacterium]